MRTKARKLIWSVPLVAVFAVVGALALFATLTPNDASAQNVGIPPGRPTNLTIVPYADTIPEEELLLTWTEPTDGGSVRQYRIDISHNGGYTWVALESDFRNNSYTHAGLDASTTLHYRVFAVNQHGISPVSNVRSGTTDDSMVPNRPANLTATVGSSSGDVEATADGDLTITLRWDAPINPPGASVKSYTVEYSEDGSRWDPVPDVKKSGQKHTGLSAGQPYQYRVAAVNSVGRSGWSSTDTDETLPAVIPEMPSVSGFEPGVVPEEVNVWLFWEPGDDPVGDPVTHYEVEGRPVRHAAIMLGSQPAKMADLRKVVDGTEEEVEANPTAEPPTLAVSDDNSGHIKIAGIHFTDVHLSGTGEDDAGAVTDDDFATVAATLTTKITTDFGVIGAWVVNGAIAHPVTVTWDDTADPDAGNIYYSSKNPRADALSGDDATESDANGPPSTDWTEVDLDGWDFANAVVTYTGLRFKLTVPVESGNASADALPAASSIGSPNVASMLGWAKGSPRRTSIGSIGTFFTGADLTDVVAPGAAAAPPAWMVVDTDISRPEATKINQYVVTTADVAGTGYGNHFIANIDWEFRVRAINGRAPARAMNTDVAEGGVNIGGDPDGGVRTLAESWSSAIEATPGSDVALKRPENLVVRRSAPDNQGRTGLILEWNKSTTVKDANGDTVDAVGVVMYRIEYSDTGTAQRGYDWKLLQASVDGTDANRQIYVDNETALTGKANDLKAGQTRHYRVLALRVNDITTEDVNENKTSWPSPQQTGNTSPPLRPDAPTDLRATATGHTHTQLEWIAPDASNDDADGSEEGSTVITHYVVSTSDDEGRTWMDLMDEDGMVLKVMETNYLDDTLMPGQTRDYRVKAVNSSQASVWSNSLDVTTLEAILPNQPGGLVAETYGSTGIKICWNAQAEQPEDAPVFEYLIEYSADGKTEWMELARVTDMDVDQVHTIYTDMTLEPDETRYYRVSAVNLRGQSDQSDVADASAKAATVPGAPMVSAMADSDAEITVTWTAPADGGSDITGYKVMWKMSSATEYAATDMATAAATARSHQVTSLTASTAYTFKAMAMNAKGDSMASDEAMATTYRTNTAPTADGTIADMTLTAGEMSSGMDVTGYFSDADMGDTLTYTASSNMPMYAIVAVSGNMVTVTGVAAGTATITVTTTDMGVGAGMMNRMTVMQTFMVTVEAAPEPMLTAPTGTTATSDAAGMVTVNWTSGDNALGHLVLLFKSDFSGDPMVGVPSGDFHTFSGVPAGSYIAVVVSYRSVSDYEYEALLSVVTVR